MRGRVIACVACAGATACILQACGTSSHPYVGRAYDEARDCLGPEASVDVVEGGDDPGTCDAVCIVQAHGPDGGRTVYVSTMCPPLPFGVDTSGADPACAHALAASARGDVCNPDGGVSSHPAEDAGAEDAGADAAGDAG